MRGILFFLFGVFLTCLAGPACGAPLELGLDEAVACALRDNRDVMLKGVDVEKSRAKIAESRAGLFPTLTASSTWSETLGFYPKNLSAVATQTTLKQYLYRGGKTVHAIRREMHQAAASEALLAGTKLDIIFEVRQAYFALILAREFRRLNRRIAQNGEAHFSAIKKRRAKGEASESEVTEAKAALKNVKSGYEASLRQVESAQELLRKLLNLDIDVMVVPQESFVFPKEQFSLEKAFLRALEDRPEMRQYREEAQAKRSAVEAARADQRPSVFVSWDYYSRSTTSLTFSPSKAWQDYSVVGVTFSWPVFDGWATRAKVDQALADVTAAEIMKEKALRDISFEVRSSYLALQDALVNIGAADAGVEFYEDIFLRTQKRHGSGLSSVLELDDALLKYEVALFNKTERVYDYCVARAAFEKAQGGY